MPGAVKGRDLKRDPRVAIHGPTTDPPPDRPAGWVGEAKVAGRGRALASPDAADRFAIDIEEAVITRLNAAGDRLVVESWAPGRGYRRLERE
jgi:hypothetical protein